MQKGGIERANAAASSIRHVFGLTAAAVKHENPMRNAAMVGRAFETDAAAMRALYLWGPEAYTMREALEHYVTRLHPEMRVGVLPLPIARLIATLTRNQDLRFAGCAAAAAVAVAGAGLPITER